MNKDLEIIKKYYGEKMMHLCRQLFATLLETDGLLSKFMLDSFAPSKFLYDDIMESEQEEVFKNYIYSKVDVEEKKIIVNKTPKELLSDAGYDLYECKTEEDIQFFKKYYAKNEELCTFNGARLKRCHVFFAVKKNVDEIKRENFQTPKREDEYGTSVISIQFTRGKVNTLSIKNRYNHRVNNPDATFSNNLENIIPGLTESFEREYNLNINQNIDNKFELLGYVKANDGRYYRYNYEINNIYYCPDNIIIDNFEVIKDYQEKEKYIVLDYFILDLVNKTIKLYDNEYIKDCFVDGIKNIQKINIVRNKETGNKEIEIITDTQNRIIIEIDKANKIVGYKNNEITEIGDYFLAVNNALEYLELTNVKKVGMRFMLKNKILTNFIMPNVIEVGDFFLASNCALKKLEMLKIKKIGIGFLFDNFILESFKAPELEEVAEDCLHYNRKLKQLETPKLRKVGNNFLYYNEALTNLELSNLEITGNNFLFGNRALTNLEFEKLESIESGFLYSSMNLKTLIAPKLDGYSFCIIQDRFNQLLFSVEINGELYGKKVKKVTKLKQSLAWLLNKISKFPFVRESNLGETKENSNVRN